MAADMGSGKGGLDTTRVEVTHDKAVTFCSSEGIREHFVPDDVEGVVKILIAPTSVGEFSKQEQSPAAVEQLNEDTTISPLLVHLDDPNASTGLVDRGT
jgi:hypothetical protein